MAWNCSSVVFWITLSQLYPALFTMMSIESNSASVACNNPAQGSRDLSGLR